MICAIWPKENMPVDDFGNRVDMIVGGASIISRTNFGKPNEHYINASIVYHEKVIREMIANGQVNEATMLFMDWLSVVSPEAHKVAIEHFPTLEDQIRMLRSELSEGPLQIWLPHYSPNIGAECIQALKTRFPLPTSPVTYIDEYGKKVRTVGNVIVGSIYNVVLEKIGDDWGSTSIPKRQHHGIPGKLTDADKSSLPWRDQAFKIFGESETRLMLGTLDPAFTALMINFPNSPAMCADAANTILTAPQPTNLKMAMDYRTHAKLPGRSTLYFKHMLAASGIEIAQGET